MYAEQRQRAELEQSAASVEDYYYSLQMVAEVAPVTPASIARVAQLTQKTNQFNLTTKRYTEADIAALSAAPNWRVYSLRVTDRFGDNGLVGVAIVENRGESWDIDTLLMSCRVIGRTVETAFLAVIAEEATRAGAHALTGWFIPTKKNAPAAGFYRDHGFQCADENEDRTLWRRDLREEPLARPAWIDVMTTGGETA
jgi:FkbH-like protein